jgi:outer membrane protein assembly factor BamE (lipoprotein component of BamABCDE complex)
MRHVTRTLKRAILAAVLVTVAACTTQYRNHGYVPSDADLERIVVGLDNRESVAQLVGRPSSAGVLDSSGWYFVESRYEHFAYRAPKEIDREVVSISFDEAGKVANIERFGLEDGRVVILSRRVTDSNVRGVGFLQQLFGNIGTFSADQFFE